MYGYVIVDKPNLLIKDYALYRAHYCGLCKELGREAGQAYRFLTSYDSTFLSVLLHNLKDYQPKMNLEGCILNEFKKKPVLESDDILKDVAAVTVLLAYFKAADDAADEKEHRAAKLALSGKRKKFAKSYPELDKAIAENYDKLSALEKDGETSLDILAHCFAKILENVITGLSGKDDENVKGFSYQLGRWIYFADAVDDVEKDLKNNVFNPVLKNYPGFSTREEYFKTYAEDLSYLLYSSYNMMVSFYDKMTVTVGEGLLSNVIYKGLPAQMDRILKGERECRRIRI